MKIRFLDKLLGLNYIKSSVSDNEKRIGLNINEISLINKKLDELNENVALHHENIGKFERLATNISRALDKYFGQESPF